LLIVGALIYSFSLLCRTSELMKRLHATGLDLTLLEMGVAMMLIPLANGVASSFLSKGTGAIRLIGRCSYEIYLTHMFVVMGLMNLIKGTQQSSFAIGGWYSVMLLLSIALGHLVFASYSEPMNRLLRQRSATTNLTEVPASLPN
jgi:peptidoglycan/LPS O-acetylase OafA/YrhL